MKKQRLFSLLAAVVMLTAGSLNAQSSNPVKANIPFDFSAGNKTYPAGAYMVTASSQTGALSILGPGSTSGLASSQPVQSNNLSGSTKLVFHGMQIGTSCIRFGLRERPGDANCRRRVWRRNWQAMPP